MVMLGSMRPSVIAFHVQRAAEGFAALIETPARGRAMIEAGLETRGAPRVREKLDLVENHMFSEELMQALISAGDDMPPQPALIIWRRLVELGIAVQLFDQSVRGFADHYLDLERLHQHLAEQTFDNLFRPPSALAEAYGEAVVAIDVRTKLGDDRRGSGFLVDHRGIEALVTCRHNVDPTVGISVLAVSSSRRTPIETGPMVLSEQHDVAMAVVRKRGEGPLFRLSGEGAMFDTVYTLGFPQVPRANEVLLGHRGEVNGVAQLYDTLGPTLILSNLVSPGSSGCPVLLPSGQCAGMTTRWLEGQYEDERARFSAAMPASVLTEVVAGLLPEALAQANR